MNWEAPAAQTQRPGYFGIAIVAAALLVALALAAALVVALALAAALVLALPLAAMCRKWHANSGNMSRGTVQEKDDSIHR
jgi:membrane protein implicated in regulation of membrane protease activity